MENLEFSHRPGAEARPARGPRPSLDKATKLVTPDPQVGWVLGLYPDAAEAGGTFHPTIVRSRGCAPEVAPVDPDRSETEAARRARTKLRRFIAGNRIRRMGTLTYAGDGQHDPKILRRQIAHFFKRVRYDVIGSPYAYLWVPEWHPGGHGLHVHFGIDRHVPQASLQEAWGRGIVDIRLFRARTGGGTLEASRLAAGYLSKYVSKAFEGHEREPGSHRYELAQGFAPRVERIVGRTREEAIALASERMGATPERVWGSEEAEEWHGPPALWMAWR